MVKSIIIKTEKLHYLSNIITDKHIIVEYLTSNKSIVVITTTTDKAFRKVLDRCLDVMIAYNLI